MRKLFTCLMLVLSFTFYSALLRSQTYCTPSVSDCGALDGNEYISNVTYGTVNNSSGCDGVNGYTDYTNLSSNYHPGNTVTVTVTNPNMFAPDDSFFIWVDFNNNGSFTDAGELVADVVQSSSTGQSMSFTIPMTAFQGPLRMRIRVSYYMSADPCSMQSWGEVEDYTLLNIPVGPMHFDSCYAITPDTSSIFQGQILNKVLQLNFHTSGGVLTPYHVDTVYCSTTGSTAAAADIIKAGFFTTNGTPLDTTKRPAFVNLPNGKMKFKIPGGFTFNFGLNSFYLAYDLKYNAMVGDVIDATFDSVMVSGVMRYPKIKNPAGNRKIIMNASYKNFCAVSRGFVGDYEVGTRRIIFGNIDNSTPTMSSSANYNFYPNTVPVVYKQLSYPISIYSGTLNNQSAAVYIDWNNDGYFSGSELVLAYTGLSPAALSTGSITIPCNASPGIHRMRITSDAGYLAAACGNIDYGECEDYLINIQPELTPTVSCTTDTTIYSGAKTYFYPTANPGGNITFRWDYDNNGTWDATANPGSYVFTTTGTKIVKMQGILTGCTTTLYSPFHYDTISVITPSTKPKVNFIVNNNIVTTSIPAVLTDLTTVGPRTWKWRIMPAKQGGNPTYTITPSDTVPNPTVQFLQIGVYDVTLVACNANGCDSNVKTQYITCLQENDMCGSTNSTQRAGYLYDDGGKYSPYNSNDNCGFLIQPKCAQAITLSFLSFDVNSLTSVVGCTGPTPPDNLKIFDGKDTNSIPLYLGPKMSGSPLYPNGLTNGANNVLLTPPPAMTATSGSMYIYFYSNCGGVGSGFESMWNTQLYTPANPVAKIGSSTTSVYRKKPVHFYSLSAGYQLAYAWDINQDGYTDYTDSSFNYGFDLAGTIRVRLVATSCTKTDTSYLNITVKNPTSKPKVDFVADYTNVTTGDIVNLFDKSDTTIYKWTWTITPNKFNFLNGTDSTKQNVTLQFTDTGYYDVKLRGTNYVGYTDTLKHYYIHVFKYCTPNTINLNTDVGMSMVTLADVGNDTLIKQPSSIGVSAYSSYSYITKPVLYQTGNYQLNLQRNTSFNSITWSVYIDYNQDGIFNSQTERVASISNFPGTSWTTTIHIPSNVPTGLTKMRIVANVGLLTNSPCGPNFSGEFEDYSIQISHDFAAPVITLVGKDTIFVNSCATYVDPGYKAWDVVNGDLTSKVVVTGLVNTLIPGWYTKSYNVADSSGNIAKQVIRYIKVLPDIVPPTIVLYGKNPSYLPVGTVWVDPGDSVFDNCSGVKSHNTYGSVNYNKIGTYNILYVATDLASPSNTDTVIRKVVVYDSIDPTISLNGTSPMIQEVNMGYVDPGATVNDNYNKHLSYILTGNVDVTKMGNYFLTYCVTDSSGNGPVCVMRKIIVKDTIPPVLSLVLGNTGSDTVIVDVFTPYNEPGYVATDNYYPAKNLVVTVTGSVNIEKLGDYILTYSAVDPSGNVSTVLKRVVRVVDRVAPTIELVGQDLVTICRWQTYTDEGVTVSDNYYPANKLIINVNKNGTYISTLTTGLYSYSYNVCDPSGNCSQTIFRVIYVDDCNSSINNQSGSELVRFYPNPASDNVKFVIKLPTSEDVNISIYNTLGERVLDVFKGNVSEDQFDVNTGSLSSGIYYVRFVLGNNQTINKKLIISK